MIKSLAVLLAVVMGIFIIGADPALGAEQSKPVSAGTYNWTGFYVGFNAGYGFGGNNSVDLAPVSSGWIPAFSAGAVAQPNSLSPSGFIGGGQIGYNYQFSRLFLGGLEADIQYTDLRDNNTQSNLNPPLEFVENQTSVDQQLKWLGTVRARVGILPVDRLLIYATGGLAYGRVDTAVTLQSLASPEMYAGSSGSTKTGWTVGGGMEYGFFKNCTVKAEYLYYDLGTQDVDITTVVGFGPSLASATFHTKGHILRAGLNYRF